MRKLCTVKGHQRFYWDADGCLRFCKIGSYKRAVGKRKTAFWKHFNGDSIKLELWDKLPTSSLNTNYVLENPHKGHRRIQKEKEAAYDRQKSPMIFGFDRLSVIFGVTSCLMVEAILYYLYVTNFLMK